MIVDRFQESQAEEVARVVKRTLLESISKHYPAAYVNDLISEHSATSILKKALTHDIFVATENGEVIGTGCLADYGTAEMPSYYGTSIFVSPNFQSRGIGKQLMGKLEALARERGATKLTVRAAVNAREFYEKLGYSFKNEISVPDERGNFVMEKTLS